MSNFISTNGYFIKGINNVKVRLYPQVLGIHKVHEHNLCNALRDFGLMIKSDSRRQLLQYNYDFLRFVHLMRSSEICMLAHGYCLLQLRDMSWWDSFTKVVSESIYDMDGKEIAGLLYSLSKVYKARHPLICKLVDESKTWVRHASPSALSLLVKVVTSLRFDSVYLSSLNKRVKEITDQLNIVDVVFFMTANTEAKTRDLDLYRMLCIRCVDLIELVELHHLRAIAASLSMGGYRSHLMFNILTVRLSQIVKSTPLKEGDVISLFLAFTTQKFLSKNDICLETRLYKNFMLKYHPKLSRSKFEYPLPLLSGLFLEALMNNVDRITANGMPIVLRAISILHIVVDKQYYEQLLRKTVTYIDNGDYKGLKLANLVVTLSKSRDGDCIFWKAIYNLLNSNRELGLDGDLVSKMIITVGGCGRSSLSSTESGYRLRVYDALLEMSLDLVGTMSTKSVVNLSRILLLNGEGNIAMSKQYLEAIKTKIMAMDNTEIVKILRNYVEFPGATTNPLLAELLDKIKIRQEERSSSSRELTNVLYRFNISSHARDFKPV